MVTAVLDSVIIVRGLISPYSRWGRLVFDEIASFELIVSPPVLAEYLDVIRRPRLTRKYRSVAQRDPQAVLSRLIRSSVVEIDEAAFVPVCRDPKDDKFLATAQAAGADYLVSEDVDLLVLKEYEGTAIIDAVRFLGVLDQAKSRNRPS